MRAMLFGLVLAILPALAGAQDLSSQRDYSDPAQRDLLIACKSGDRESFPGKTLGEVFGADWPVQPVPSSADAHSSAQLLERGPMRWPSGMDFQNAYIVVAVLVGSDGKPLRAEVLCSTGMGFDTSVRRHAMASTYAPAEVDGKPITSVLVRVVSFRPSSKSRLQKPGR
ncbi:energy transducer TonB [Thermomonas sp.]